MSYKIAIRRVADSVVRVYHSDLEWREEPDAHMKRLGMEQSPDEYWWTEGNGGCDCNRALFFEYAGSDREPAERCAELDPPCGEGAYAIDYVELPSGKRIKLS